MKHRPRTAAVLATLTLALAACGDDQSPDEAASTTVAVTGTTDGAAEVPEQVTIDHRYGSTTLETAPERIVSLDNQWTDVLIALDAPLAGAALDPVVEGGRFPWQDAIPETVEPIPVDGTTIPLEAVAALRPDLIVITFFATDQSTYDRLNEIAPTIGPLGDEEVDAWQDIATTAGALLGTPDEAEALIEEAEQRSADVLADLPGLEGRDYALANYVPGDAIYVVADPDDGAATFFAQLGLTIDPGLLDIADGASGRAELSLEQIEHLDSDLLIMLTNGADPNDIPGYANLPAVQSGAVAILDLAAVSGLNTPSPLSIPYSLETIRSALEAAAAAPGG